MDVCINCQSPFDVNQHMPMNLPCSHAICKQCLSLFKKSRKNKCPKCELVLPNLKNIKPHQIILSMIQNTNLSQSDQDNQSNNKREKESEEDENSQSSQQIEENSQSQANQTYTDSQSENTYNSDQINQPETCIKHQDKIIEFFCQTCTTAVCSICIFETHNGHHLTLLQDMSTIIKNNVKDFGKILKNLEKVNEDNQLSVENKIEEVKKQNEYQKTLVFKSFEEIKKKIDSKQDEIMKEFEGKYEHEEKRFKKIQNCLKGDFNQMNRIAFINEELTKNFQKFSDAKILKKIDEFTSFLHKSAADIKRLYKTEISLKAELVIDPAMKPIPINITDLINLLEKIDSKSICYPLDDILRESNSNDNDNDDNMSYKKNHDRKGNANGESSHFHHQQIEKQTIEHEIDNYLNRIGSIESEKTDSDNYNTDGNHSRLHNKIPKQRKIFLQQIRDNQVDQMNNRNINNSLQMYRDRRKRETAASRQYNNNNNNNNQLQQNYNYQSNINSCSIKPWRYQTDKQMCAINRVPSADNSSKRSQNSFNLSLPLISSEPDIDSASIYCFGEASYCLKFSIAADKWEIIKYTESNKILGHFRYHSVCTLPGQKMVLTGGVKTIDDEATNITLEINTKNINEVKALNPMLIKRYGHGSIYYHGYIYAIGGYEHHDQKTTSMLSTLKVCERYHYNTQRWESISNLNHPRSFFGLGIFVGSIFVFGGLYNDQLLASIEKYDLLTNVWITYHIKLPEKLSKMGVIHYKKDTVLLLGGLNEDYKPISVVRQSMLDQSNGWFKSTDMLYPHTAGSSAFLWDNKIFVLGGSIDGICEKYDFNTMKWEILEGYIQAIKANKQEEIIKNFSCAFNLYLTKG